MYNSQIKLFCLPHGGGSASVYNSWIRPLREVGIQVVPLEYQGHGLFSDKPLSKSIEDEALFLLDQIIPLWDDNSCFLGHSMGAIVLYELCKNVLYKHGIHPNKIFLSGSASPFHREKGHNWNNLPRKDFIDFLKQNNSLPDVIFESNDLLEYFIPILLNDYKIIYKYTVIHDFHKINIPAVILNGINDSMSETSIEAWGELFSHKPDFYYLEGGHMYLQDKKNQLEIFDIITDEMNNKRRLQLA